MLRLGLKVKKEEQAKKASGPASSGGGYRYIRGSGGFAQGSSSSTVKQIDINALFTPKRFSNFWKPLSTIFRRLKDLKMLAPLRDPIQIPPGSDKSKFCTFHQQFTHHTDDCRTLRNRIQDLIDNGTIADPEAQNPNVNKNPLPNYKK